MVLLVVAETGVGEVRSSQILAKLGSKTGKIYH